MDVKELIEWSRARTQHMLKPNVIDELADALETLEQENTALKQVLEARIT